MKRLAKIQGVGCLLLVLSAVPLLGQLNIPAGRLPGGVLWSSNSVGVVGGIPNVTTIYTNFNSTATVGQIENAIQTCPSNEVVYLNAGTYSLTSTLWFGGSSSTINGVVLRGAGIGKTIIRPPSDVANIIGLQGSGWFGNMPSPSDFVNWTSGYAQGTTNITISANVNAEGSTPLAVGNMVILTQADDPNVVNATGNEDTTTVFNNSSGQTCDEVQLVMVTGIKNGTNLTIWPGIYMTNIQASLKPMLTWQDSGGGSRLGPMLMDGVEDLTIDFRNGGSGDNGIIELNTYNCWVKDVESTNSWYSAVKFLYCAHDTVQDSYFHDCAGGGASTTYGVNPCISSDILVQDNIFYRITSPILEDRGSSGCVFGYNFCTNTLYAVSPGAMMAAITTHAAHPDMNLFEGNVGTEIEYDDVHGSSSHNMTFRNCFYGHYDSDYAPGIYTNYTIAVTVEANNLDISFVGNVLGTSGYSTIYESSPTATPGVNDSQQVVYNLGYFDGNNTANQDLRVVTSFWRDGNYDYATQSTIWDSNGARTLPASLYLVGQPSWWSNYGNASPWPPIGPDVTPMVCQIPAHVRFLELTSTNVILPPLPPTNFRASGP